MAVSGAGVALPPLASCSAQPQHKTLRERHKSAEQSRGCGDEQKLFHGASPSSWLDQCLRTLEPHFHEV